MGRAFAEMKNELAKKWLGKLTKLNAATRAKFYVIDAEEQT